jgi:hypothetical protein
MAGVGLVGFSGSLIKDSIKDAPLPSFQGPNASGLPQTSAEEPEVTRVLVGESRGRHRCHLTNATTSRGLFHPIRSGLVSNLPSSPDNCFLIRVLSPSTATQFVVEGMSMLSHHHLC